MRVPIAVQIEPFDVEQVQPQIDATREAFVRYLDEAPQKSTRSKHGLMGPVGKILGEIKSGRRDAPSLKGYAIRVHEARASGRSPSSVALVALEQGIDCLLDLLGRVPVTARDQILDRLDYGLYFDLRKNALASKETRRQVWIGFLRDRYGSEAALSAAWGEEVLSFDEIYLPRGAEGAKGKRATARQRAIAAFWESQGVTALVGEEDEE